MTALVVGKSVLVANALPTLRRFHTAPVIQTVLFKTVIYWAVVFLVRFLEVVINGDRIINTVSQCMLTVILFKNVGRNAIKAGDRGSKPAQSNRRFATAEHRHLPQTAFPGKCMSCQIEQSPS